MSQAILNVLLGTGVKTIDNYKKAVFDGNMYTGAIYSALTAGQTIKATFTTPADKTIRFLPAIIQGLVGSLQGILYEGSSGNTGGTAMAATNRNRNSLNTSSCVIKTGETVTSNGTAMGAYYLLPSTVPTEGIVSEVELILKKSTVYTLAITNTASTANAVVAELTYYEE